MNQDEYVLLRVVGVKITQALRDEFVKQGHHLTGALENSITYSAFEAWNGDSKLVGTIAYYGKILNFGVTAARIPFFPGSGNTYSKYIAGLINFWMLRGKTEKEAKSAAFATAYKQKGRAGIAGSGMPTPGSYSFSTTGERKNFIDIVDGKIQPEIETIIMDGLRNNFNNKMAEFQRKFDKV